jgi:hypothetical protein
MSWLHDRRSVRCLIRSKTLWVSLAFTLIWYWCFRYLTTASARDPTSFFFDEKTGYERRYSLQREKEARSFIESANRTDTPALPISNTSMCIGVATIKRPTKEQYVRSTIGSLLEGLSVAERSQIYLIIFIAHTESTIHPIYHEPWLKAVSNKVLTYSVPEDDMASLWMFEKENLVRNKSMYDYGYLLNNCLKTKADWITIIEDDVIARAGWYSKTINALHEIQAQKRGSGWLYLRMFYTESFFGYVSEHWMRYLAFSLMLFFFVLAIAVEARRKSERFRRNISNVHIAMMCCCCLPACISLYFMAGYVTLHPSKPGVRLLPEFGCCSQGFVFPSFIVPSIIERTHEAMHEDSYPDMLLEGLADSEGLDRFAHFPSLLQHIGLNSSKGVAYDKSAERIFNFDFETSS